MIRGHLVRESVLVGVVAALLALWVLRAWELDPTVPVLYESDALLHLAYIENLHDGGWYLWNERLAAPFGQDVRDFPLGGENLHWAALKLLAMVTPNAPAAATAYLFLTYILVAVVTYLVARLLRLGPGVAAVVALLFAFAPFHQWRWTMHLLRAGYYPVALGGLVILWMLDWQRELREQSAGARPRWRRRRLVLVLATAALLGSSDTQNALYAALLLLPAALLISVRDRDLRPAALALVFGLTAGVALVANNAPYLLARAERGPNPAVLWRTPTEQEVYGLRPARLVLPVENHRVALFADVTAAAARWSSSPYSGGQELGAAAACGFIIGLVAVGSAALGRPLLPAAPISLARLGLLMITAVLWATAGGFAYLLSLAGLTSYRTWNRISLWIALFALLALGSVLQRLVDRLRRRWIASALLVALLIVGVLDQVPQTIEGFDPKQLSREWRDDAEFFRQVEAALPAGAFVYQLPASVFPEPGRLRELGPYEHLKPYLHTAALRFSYGGMKGRREGTWLEALDPLGPAGATAALALSGVDGALVDRRGYADRGAAQEVAMASVGAVRTVVDGAGTRALWDLRPVRARLGGAAGPESDVARALFDPHPPRFDQTFYWEEREAGHRWRWAAGSDARIRLDGANGPRRVTVTAMLDHLDPKATAVTVGVAGRTVAVPIPAGPARFTAAIDVPAGGTTLRLRSDGQPQWPPKDRRHLGIQVRDLAVTDHVLLRRLCTGAMDGAAHCDALRAPLSFE